MNKVIWKYPLEVTDYQELELPKGAKILSVGESRDGELALWALIPHGPLEKEKRKFRIAGTGHFITPSETQNFIGTVITNDGFLVWHIFEI